MSFDQDQIKNKMIQTPPAKKGYHFASDGVHFAQFVEAASIGELGKNLCDGFADAVQARSHRRLQMRSRIPHDSVQTLNQIIERERLREARVENVGRGGGQVTRCIQSRSDQQPTLVDDPQEQQYRANERSAARDDVSRAVQIEQCSYACRQVTH